MKSYGWYEYHDDPWLMRNAKTNQELHILELQKETKLESMLKKWPKKNKEHFLSSFFGTIKTALGIIEKLENTEEIELLYIDDEIEQIIPISIIYTEDKVKRFSIVVNYNMAFKKEPSYGVWRRIDDFLVDALLCWPEGVFEERFLSSVIVIGGWFQAKWSSTLKRRFSGRKSYNLKDNKPPRHIVDGYMTALDLPVPLQWSYVDKENPATEASLNFNVDEEFKTCFIDKNDEIAGFQDKVPYLVREDNKAFIFIAELEPTAHRGEDPETRLWYTYVDENVFFTFRSCFSYGLELSTCKYYGYREMPPREEFWATDIFGEYKDKPYVGGYGHSYLSYRTWKMALNALMDAWPQWRQIVENGMVRKMEIPQSVELPKNYGRHAYVGNYGPKIQGGYTGGISNIWHTIHFDK